MMQFSPVVAWQRRSGPLRAAIMAALLVLLAGRAVLADSSLTYPSSTLTVAAGTNNHDETVGIWEDGSESIWAYTYDGSSYTNLPITCDGGTSTLAEALGLNDDGDVVGECHQSDGVVHGFVRSAGGTFINIDPPNSTGTSARGIDSNASVDSGTAGSPVVVGTYYDTVQSMYMGFVATPDGRGGYTYGVQITPDPSATWSSINSINNAGFYVGTYEVGGIVKGFVYDGSGYTDVSYPGADFTVATGINNSAAPQIAGWYEASSVDYGFAGNYSGGTISNLGLYQHSSDPSILTGTNDRCGNSGSYVSSGTTYGLTHGGDISASGAGFDTEILSSSLDRTVAVATNNTDLYILSTTGVGSPVVFTLKKVDWAGVVTVLVSYSAASSAYRGMTIAGHYLFLIDSVHTTINRYSLTGDFSTYDTLFYGTTLSSPQKIISNYQDRATGYTMFVSGSTKKLMYFQGDAVAFASSTISTIVTRNVYVAIAYRSGGMNGVRYLYGVYGSGTFTGGTLTPGGMIDEVNIASLPVVSTTTMNIPTEIVLPSLITWIKETSSFVMTDNFGNGAYSATAHGAIYSYVPTTDFFTGAISSFGSGTSVLSGAANGILTHITNGLASTDGSQDVNGEAAIGYNYVCAGFVNLYVGTSSVGATNDFIKLYDASRTDFDANKGGS